MSTFLAFPPGHGILYGLILYGIGLLIIAMLIRAIASWFRVDERYAFIRFLAKMTDPFITPLRRIVPPLGFLDVSWLITLFFLITIQTLLLQAMPFGW